MKEKNKYLKALSRENKSTPPIWFMRQAGRYHSHYQKIRAQYSFIEMCKIPAVATEITFGPLDDFGFDAAILFSDLLFPLETMGMGLTYEPGPKLSWHLKSKEDLFKFKAPQVIDNNRAKATMDFQAHALKLISQKLPEEKGLIGFVGGPFTLYCYAVEGSHQGELQDSKKGLTDGRYEGFLERLIPLLSDNMILQAEAGAHAVAMFDTCAGEVDAKTYARYVVPGIQAVLERFKARCPNTPVIYYSKKTDAAHWRKLEGLPISCLGVDWRTPLKKVIEEFGSKYAIQGNINPDWMFLPAEELEKNLREVFASVKNLDLSGYVCGLGHGVLPGVPESNVRLSLKVAREVLERKEEN